jgi:hypothetical protein
MQCHASAKTGQQKGLSSSWFTKIEDQIFVVALWATVSSVACRHPFSLSFSVLID